MPPHRARRKQTARTGVCDDVRGREVLRNTGCHGVIPTPLKQPSLYCLSDGLMGPVDCQKVLEQLHVEPLVKRVEVEQREDDGHQTRPPTILREQQRSSGGICVETAGRTCQRLRKTRFRCSPSENRPLAQPGAAEDGPPRRQWRRRSSSGHLAKPLAKPLPTALRRWRSQAMLPVGLTATSETISSPLTRAGGAALRGRTIIGQLRRSPAATGDTDRSDSSTLDHMIRPPAGVAFVRHQQRPKLQRN